MTVMPSTGARIASFEPGRITTGQHCSKGQAYRAIGEKIISKLYEEKKAPENKIQMSASLMMSKEADLMISRYRKGIIWDRDVEQQIPNPVSISLLFDLFKEEIDTCQSL
jgi:hypothetical protein